MSTSPFMKTIPRTKIALRALGVALPIFLNGDKPFWTSATPDLLAVSEVHSSSESIRPDATGNDTLRKLSCFFPRLKLSGAIGEEVILAVSIIRVAVCLPLDDDTPA